MKNIQVIKIGTTVNLSIDGKLYKKNCSNETDAQSFFKTVLKAKENPTDENIKTIKMFLNEINRKALIAGIESDVETGEAYLAGFNTPIPEILLDTILEYNENGYPIDAIINYWKLLMINPDKRVRTSLFDFIKTHDFVITDKGYIVVYKAVEYCKNEENNKTFDEFISNKYLHVKKTWKCNPNKYVVYKNNTNGTFHIAKFEVSQTWNEKEDKFELLGKLGDLYNAIVLTNNQTETKTMYTDIHTKSMKIQLGVPVKMDRKDCNSDPAIDCSYGLHVGATKYVETFAKYNSPNRNAVLVCFVNPANVVAVPNYDHSKIRVTEYFPFATATFDGNKIDIIEQKYFENDYCNYEVSELENLIAKVKAEEIPIPTAKNAEKEERSMPELMNMLTMRVRDLCY